MSMRRLRDRLRDDERGATLIMVTLSLVVLMGFAAFAIDAAAARSQRRENQGAVDTAALSAIQLTANKLRADAVADATTEVIRISYESIFNPTKPGDPTFPEWQAAWGTCVDADKPGSFSITGSSDCVSFSTGLQQMRVRLPQIDVDTTFGAVLGRDVISTGAVAVVGVSLRSGVAAVLPFGLPGNAAGDGHVCLKTGPDPQSEDPCDGPTTGNFSFLDITHFGYLPYGTPTQCNGQTNTRLARNIAQGIDHVLSTAPSALAASWQDRALCSNGNFSSRPYTLTTETGNGKGGSLMDGLVDGIAGLPGRLTQPGGPTASVGSETIDNEPLWTYLNANGTSVCGSFTGAPDDHDLLVACLENPANHDAGGDWNAGVIFSETIAESERFAWVPLFWDAMLGSGSTDHNIRYFSPVYLQTTFWKCNATRCKYVHDPGESTVVAPGNGNNASVEAVTAIQIPIDALPDSVAVDGNPSSPGALVYTLLE